MDCIKLGDIFSKSQLILLMSTFSMWKHDDNTNMDGMVANME